MSNDLDIDLDSVLDQLVQAIEEPQKKTRKSDKTWDPDRKLTDEEVQLIKDLIEVLGSGPVLSEPDGLNDDQLQHLMDEIGPIRRVKDILEGRHDSIRATVFSAMDFRNADKLNPSLEPDEFEIGERKFVREIRGGKPFVDADKLREAVSEDVWSKILITTTTNITKRLPDGTEIKDEHVSYEVDEGAVAIALKEGILSVSDLRKSVGITKRTAAFKVV